MVKKYPQLGEVGVNAQCWTSNCAGPDEWSSVMTSFTGTCPTTVQICAQSLTVSDIAAQNIGEIGNKCSLNSDVSSNAQSTTTNNDATTTTNTTTGGNAITNLLGITKGDSSNNIFYIGFFIMFIIIIAFALLI